MFIQFTFLISLGLLLTALPEYGLEKFDGYKLVVFCDELLSFSCNDRAIAEIYAKVKSV